MASNEFLNLYKELKSTEFEYRVTVIFVSVQWWWHLWICELAEDWCPPSQAGCFNNK